MLIDPEKRLRSIREAESVADELGNRYKSDLEANGLLTPEIADCIDATTKNLAVEASVDDDDDDDDDIPTSDSASDLQTAIDSMDEDDDVAESNRRRIIKL